MVCKLEGMSLGQSDNPCSQGTQFLLLQNLVVGLGDAFRSSGTKVLSLSDATVLTKVSFGILS